MSWLTVVRCGVNCLLNRFATFLLSDIIVPPNEIAASLSFVFLYCVAQSVHKSNDGLAIVMSGELLTVGVILVGKSSFSTP